MNHEPTIARGTACIELAAKVLSVSTKQVVEEYRGAAYSLAAWANWSDLQMIAFVRACLAVRHPLIRGRHQFNLAVEVLVQEKILFREIP